MNPGVTSSTRFAVVRKRDAESGASESPFDERDVAAREQRVLFRNRQTESNPVLLEGNGRLEGRAGLLLTYTRPGVVDFDDDVGTGDGSGDQYGALGARRFCRVLQQIRDDALHEVCAGAHARRAVVVLHSVDRVGMCGREEGDALGDERVEIEA